MALTQEEKGQLAQRIARGVQVVCSSIAQLHLGSPNPNLMPYEDETGIVQSLREHGVDKWKFTNIEGALLLTKDQQGILHFRIYDLQQYKLRFQYELYEGMNYIMLNDQVHAFEMENCMCGFSFSSKAVAEKFYKRVQNFKPRATQPVQVQQQYRQPNIQNAVSKGFDSKSSYMKKSNTAGKRSTAVSANDSNIYLGNGMLDPNNVPTEWKKILKKAGIKKKDLKNPKMFEIIKETLESHNIALDPPTDFDFNDPRLKQYYTQEQIEEWKRYKREMEQYEQDKARYEREMAEFKRQEEKQRKLEALMKQQDTNQGRGGMSAKQRLRQSVAANHGNQMAQFSNLLPSGGAKQMPRMSVARPVVPALPPIPREEKIAQIVGSRASRVIMKTSMLEGLKGGNIDLRRVSVLPKLDKQTTGQQNSILETLRQRLADQREALEGGEEGDSDTEWDE